MTLQEIVEHVLLLVFRFLGVQQLVNQATLRLWTTRLLYASLVFTVIILDRLTIVPRVRDKRVSFVPVSDFWIRKHALTAITVVYTIIAVEVITKAEPRAMETTKRTLKLVKYAVTEAHLINALQVIIKQIALVRDLLILMFKSAQCAETAEKLTSAPWENTKSASPAVLNSSIRRLA